MKASLVSHLDIVPLKAKGNGRGEPPNATSRDQHPQRICRRAHRRTMDDQNRQLAMLLKMRDVSGGGRLRPFFLSAQSLSFLGRKGGSP